MASSIVPESALVSFCPDEEPFIAYAKSPFQKRFLNDPAIVRALAYWNAGEIPLSFKWLLAAKKGIKGNLIQNGYKMDELDDDVDINVTSITENTNNKFQQAFVPQQTPPSAVGRKRKSLSSIPTKSTEAGVRNSTFEFFMFI